MVTRRRLNAFLRELGYQEQQGTWQHPERKVIFLGDFAAPLPGTRGPAGHSCLLASPAV